MRVRDINRHLIRALRASRALLVKIKRDLENQIRGLFKNFGLVRPGATFWRRPGCRAFSAARKRKFMAPTKLIAAAVGFIAATAPAAPQDWPGRPLTLVVP